MFHLMKFVVKKSYCCNN